MIDQVCSGHAKGKHVHIQLSTEFSGAGTAEFAAKALCPGGRVLILINIQHTFFIDIDLVLFY